MSEIGAQGRNAATSERAPLGEIAGLEVSIAAANEKLAAMNRHGVVLLGMPEFRHATGRQG
ncbi:hypothetical protein [Streptomyces sp. NPDC088726]|uniref:hypothetical protein n=1 Tax=Streptomyces sp. NPDC088726 TaxID=3365874 RepID=UPI00382AE669